MSLRHKDTREDSSLKSDITYNSVILTGAKNYMERWQYGGRRFCRNLIKWDEKNVFSEFINFISQFYIKTYSNEQYTIAVMEADSVEGDGI